MIALTQTLIVLIAAFYNFRIAIAVFVGFFAFSPRSLGFLLGGSEFSLTFVRLTFPLLLTLYFMARTGKGPSSILTGKDILANKVFFAILVLGLYKIFATLINGVNPIYALEGLAFSAGPFALFFLISSNRMFRAISAAIVISCVAIAGIVSIEMLIETPLHFFVANPILFQEDILVVSVTDRGYRAQAIFDNSLSLAEYLLYALPIVLFLRTTATGFGRLKFTGLIGLMFFSGLMTGSRGFLLFGTITLLAYWFFFNWHRFSRSSKALLVLTITPLFLFSMLGLGVLITQFIEQSTGVRFSEIDSATDRSTMSRALQFQEVFTLLLQRPFIGYGVLQNFSAKLEAISRIDNYYLRSGLEAGFAGLVLFIVFILTAFRAMVANRVGGTSKEGRAFFAMSLSLIMAFMGAKVFLSMPANNFIFYALLGLMFGMKKRMERTAQNAHPPHS